ncbi:MAG: hypothetical protein ABI367_05560 [Mucilaginibacter sp.]
MKAIYFIFASLLLTGCLKADIVPTPAKSSVNTTTAAVAAKTDTIKSVSSTETDTSNPDYWYNGTTGTALIQVTCKDCTAMATIGTTTVPFLFNANGVGMLKYTPAPGLLIQIAVCPGSTKSIKADIFDSKNTSSYAYSGVIASNWVGTYIVK